MDSLFFKLEPIFISNDFLRNPIRSENQFVNFASICVLFTFKLY